MIDPYVEQLSHQLAASKEREVGRQLASYFGLRVQHSVCVTARRPRWMPDLVYRWLMRTILVTEGPTIVYDQRVKW